jgi:hypothetical protein
MDGNRDKGPVLLFLLAGLFFVSACAVPPQEKTVRDTLTRHFEERHYKVIEITVGGMRPISLDKKTYMGTEGYVVEIRSITLESTRDAGIPGLPEKREKMTFRDAAVQIREKTGEKGTWVISNVSGIPLL